GGQILPRLAEHSEHLARREAPSLEPRLELPPGVVQELVDGVARGAPVPDPLAGRPLVAHEGLEPLPLPLGELGLDDLLDHLPGLAAPCRLLRVDGTGVGLAAPRRGAGLR